MPPGSQGDAMRKTLIDALSGRVGKLDGDLTAVTAANCQVPVEPYVPQRQPEPPACGVPIIAGEMVLPDWDALLLTRL